MTDGKMCMEGVARLQGVEWVQGGEALVDSHYRRGQHSGAGLPKRRAATVNVRASRGWV